MFLYKRNICYILENLILFFIEPRRSEHRSNADKYTLTQLWFSTKYQRWNNTGSSTLNRRNSFKVVSTLFCQRWNNVEKHTSAQLSFSTKFQRWNNVGSSTLNQRNSIDIVSTSFCQRWNNVDKCTSAQLPFSTKYQRWCVCWVSVVLIEVKIFSLSLKMSCLRCFCCARSVSEVFAALWIEKLSYLGSFDLWICGFFRMRHEFRKTHNG